MPRKPAWLKMPFLEALEYFQKKVALPADNVSALQAEYHDFAFVVSGLTRADLLQDMKILVERAIAEGTDLEDFKRGFDRAIGRRGWQPKEDKDKRLYTILDTNVRRAYAAGRYQQATQPAILENRPYWIWKHRDSVVPRPNHLALDNKAIPADHPFWKVAVPSCAFGCRCTFFTANERLLEKMGAEILKNPPDPNEVAEKGFRRAPGTTPIEQRKDVLKTGMERQSPEMRKQIRKELKKKGVL